MKNGRRGGRVCARILLLGAGALTAAALAPGSVSAASTQKLLYSFCATGEGLDCTDGEYPEGGLIRDAAGNFYSTTSEGGADGAGTVFEISPSKTGTGWAHKLLYRFCAQGGDDCTDGAYPYAGVIRDAAGHLYGTTAEGGFADDGTVFELTPPAPGKTRWAEKVLYGFCQLSGCTDGLVPEAGLVADASGNLYGTTLYGGADDEGTVFELTPPKAGQTVWTETVIYSFCTQPSCTDGAYPYAGMIRDALSGNLYGTTYFGGAKDEGTVFELTPPATGQTVWTPAVLYSFCAQSSCTDGERPDARLTRDPSGNLYGTTTEGGAYGAGTVFELARSDDTAWTEIVLHSFCSKGGTYCTDGRDPEAGLIRDPSGKLYGTTNEGGAGGTGTVFELTPSDDTLWTEIVLYSFCAEGGRNCTDGAYPDAGLFRDPSGDLFGTTNEGGAYGGAQGGGTVFELPKAP